MSSLRAQPTLLATALAAGLLASSGAAFGQSLLQVYREALSNDPTYAAARAQNQAVGETVTEARGALLPNASLSGNASRGEFQSNLIGPNSVSGSAHGYTLQLSQPLFRYQAYKNFQQAQLAVITSEEQLAAARQDLIIRTAQAYFDVLGAEDSLAFTRAQKAAISEQLASAKRNFQVGTATITDSNEAQARFDLSTAQEIAAENDLQVKRYALQAIISKAPAELTPLKPKVQLPQPQPASIDQWVSSSEAGNTTVKIAENSLEIATRETEKARGGHLPTVDLVASSAYSHNPSYYLSNTGQRISQIGVQVNVPLFAGFATQARVRETLSLKEQSRQQLEAAKRFAAQNARATYLGVTNGLAQVRALEAAEISNQSALESNQLGYKVGMRVNIDVLNAQQQLYQTRRDLSKARYDTVMSGLKLKQAAGQLNDNDIDQVDTLLGR
jgi:outer membrane protein